MPDPIEISDEAVNAGKMERTDPFKPIGYFIQQLLDAKTEKLRKNISRHFTENEQLNSQLHAFRRENDQLKEQLDYRTDIVVARVTDINNLRFENEQLRKENEQLKQYIADYRALVRGERPPNLEPSQLG